MIRVFFAILKNEVEYNVEKLRKDIRRAKTTAAQTEAGDASRKRPPDGAVSRNALRSTRYKAEPASRAGFLP